LAFAKALAILVLLIVLAVVSLFLYPSMRPPARTVRSLGTISVDAPFRFSRSFIDYMALEGSTLYAAFASHDLVGLIDTRASRGIAAVGQLSRVHGIALVPELKLAFTSNGGDNTVGILDLARHELLKKNLGGEDPDAILYDAKPRLVYVADHDGKTATLLDPASGGVIATIALGGEPEYCQADPESGLVYQNLQDTSEVVVVDPVKRAIIRRYKLGSVIRQDSPDRYRVLEDAPTHFGGHSLVVDPVTHRVYIAYFGSVAVYEPVPGE
jgi:hypothetical protein